MLLHKTALSQPSSLRELLKDYKDILLKGTAKHGSRPHKGCMLQISQSQLLTQECNIWVKKEDLITLEHHLVRLKNILIQFW